jgi:hypothetical protein
MSEELWVVAVVPAQPVQRGILKQSLSPFHPFQQAVVMLIPYQAHSRIPKLMKVLNNAFDHRIEFPGQFLYRLAPLVDFQTLGLPPNGRLRCTTHKRARHQYPVAIDLAHNGAKRKPQKAILSWIALLALATQIHDARFLRVQRQPTGCHAFPDARKHELRLSLGFAMYNDVISVALKRLLRMMQLHPPIKYCSFVNAMRRNLTLPPTEILSHIKKQTGRKSLLHLPVNG